MAFYRSWLANGYHGDMQYLADQLDLKATPKKYWNKAESALVFARSYYPFPDTQSTQPLSESRMALYAQGQDYHHWFKRELSQISEELKSIFPEAEFLALTDSSPVLERDLAYRAGLGWVGKNSCLIHQKKGSLFFIGEIYTNLAIESSTAVSPDFCGTCTRCLDICPTRALSSPRVLDATKCISYWTIESKTTPPEDLRAHIGDWLFGCDLCQTVCPWNQKIFKNKLETQLRISDFDREALIAELRELMILSGKQLEKKFAGTALQRARAFGLRRNAIIVATNQLLNELIPEIKALGSDTKLSELVEWSLKLFAKKG